MQAQSSSLFLWSPYDDKSTVEQLVCQEMKATDFLGFLREESRGEAFSVK